VSVEEPLNAPQDFGTDATQPGVHTCGAGDLEPSPYSFKENKATIARTTVMTFLLGFLMKSPPFSIFIARHPRLRWILTGVAGAMRSPDRFGHESIWMRVKILRQTM
jgi:hypothetical protein